MPVHDAFISYSRKDKGFASKLEKTLENYIPPKGLPVPQRHLSVFRDEEDFTGAAYYESLERHLRDSEKLIVICSPRARASQYVNDEIRRFAQTKGAEHIIPLLVAGIPDNEASPEQESEKAFPSALLEYMEMPLAGDYRGFDLRRDKLHSGKFENTWYTTLANLYGISRGELEQRDKKRQARRRQILMGVAASIGAVLTGLTIWALVSRHDAIIQARFALSRQLAAQAQGALIERLDVGLLLSVAAVKIQDTLEARQSLLAALQNVTPRPTFLWGQDRCTAVRFSPDGQRIAMACGSLVTLRNAANSEPTTTLIEGRKSPLTALNFLPDGRALVATSLDGSLLVWDVTTPTSPPRVFEIEAGNLLALAMSHDGSMLALGGAPDGSIQLWSATNWTRLGSQLYSSHGRVWSLAFSRHGTLAAGTEDGRVVVWKNLKGNAIDLAPAHQGRVWKVAFSPDGELLASAGGDGHVKLWSATSASALGNISAEPTHADGALSLAFSPDSKRLASGGRNHRVVIWDLATRRPIVGPVKVHQNSVLDLSFSVDGTVLASASQDNTVILWNLLEVNPLEKILGGHKDSVIRVDFVKNGSVLVTQSIDGTIVVWDVDRQRPTNRLEGNVAAWFNRDFNVWAFAEKESGVQLYDMVNKRALHERLQGHDGEVRAAAFSPDGKILATGGEDGVVVLWDVLTGKPIGQALKVTTGEIGVTGIAFNPTGTVLGTASQREVNFWDVSSGNRIGMPLVGHNERRLIWGLSFDGDGKTVASSGFDGKIALWDAASRRQFGYLQGQHGRMFGLSFSGNGKLLASGAEDGKVLLWNVDFHGWQSLACSIANRDLSTGEWEQYVGKRVAYVSVCPALP